MPGAWLDATVPVHSGMVVYEGDPPVDVSRRRFLLLALGLVLAPARAARAAFESRVANFSAEVGLLYGVLGFRLAGTIDERIDRAAGRYGITVRGQGDGFENAIDSEGRLHAGRWAPVRTRSRFLVQGRESTLDVAYDHAARRVEYHSRSETFLLRRIRAADDVLTVPDGIHVDDVLSATLNYADALWRAEPDGSFRTHVVRRQRPTGEGADDVQRVYRAELVPFVLRIAPDAETGRSTALFDLTRFSSWAREDRPARIVFGPDRRPQAITTSLMLGTSVVIRISGA